MIKEGKTTKAMILPDMHSFKECVLNLSGPCSAFMMSLLMGDSYSIFKKKDGTFLRYKPAPVMDLEANGMNAVEFFDKVQKLYFPIILCNEVEDFEAILAASEILDQFGRPPKCLKCHGYHLKPDNHTI